MRHEQLALDGFEDTPARPVPKRPAKGISWTQYRPKKAPRCDDCVTVLELAKGQAPASRMARWRRRADDGTDLLLCSSHAQQRQDWEQLHP